jgi:hypothetical protein
MGLVVGAAQTSRGRGALAWGGTGRANAPMAIGGAGAGAYERYRARFGTLSPGNTGVWARRRNFPLKANMCSTRPTTMTTSPSTFPGRSGRQCGWHPRSSEGSEAWRTLAGMDLTRHTADRRRARSRRRRGSASASFGGRGSLVAEAGTCAMGRYAAGWRIMDRRHGSPRPSRAALHRPEREPGVDWGAGHPVPQPSGWHPPRGRLERTHPGPAQGQGGTRCSALKTAQASRRGGSAPRCSCPIAFRPSTSPALTHPPSSPATDAWHSDYRGASPSIPRCSFRHDRPQA